MKVCTIKILSDVLFHLLYVYLKNIINYIFTAEYNSEYYFVSIAIYLFYPDTYYNSVFNIYDNRILFLYFRHLFIQNLIISLKTLLKHSVDTRIPVIGKLDNTIRANVLLLSLIHI